MKETQETCAPVVGQLWQKKSRSRRVREIYVDESHVTHIRYLEGFSPPKWCTLEEWLTWTAKAELTIKA